MHTGFDGVEGVHGEVLSGAGEHVLVEVEAVVGGGDGVHGEVGAVGFGELNWVVVIQSLESNRSLEREVDCFGVRVP